MTDMEKRTILTMRKNGNSYAAIAKELTDSYPLRVPQHFKNSWEKPAPAF